MSPITAWCWHHCIALKAILTQASPTCLCLARCHTQNRKMLFYCNFSALSQHTSLTLGVLATTKKERKEKNHNMDSKWSHLWSTAITWRADGVGGKENGACGLTNEYPGGFSLIGAEEWKYDGANDIQAFFYVRQFPLPLSEWTLKEDEAEHRKQIGSPWLWLYVWANWNQSTKESHSLFGTCNRFFMEVSIHGCVCVYASEMTAPTRRPV